MTTETPKAADKASEKPKDEEQSLLPTVLAFAAILVVAGVLIFWPSDDEGSGGAGGKTAAAAADGKGKGEAGGGAGGQAAGVGARQVDAATTPQGRGTRNPAIKMPPGGREMKPMPDALPKDPPADASVEEKIAFYEKRLEQATQLMETRKKFVDRLPDVLARIDAGPNPEEGRKAFEKRKAIVEDNYAKAQADVADIEKKLAELRGS